MIFEVLFAAASQKVDAFGIVLKPLMPFLVIVVVLKMLELSIPKRRRIPRNYKKRRNEKYAYPYGRNLIPCPDCNCFISLKATVCPHCGAPVDVSYVKEIKKKKENEQRIERKLKESCVGCMTSLCGLAVFVCTVIYGSGWNLVIWSFVGLLLFILPILSGFLRFNKGRIGEWIVSSRLRKGLPENEYTILNDVYLPIQNNETTQIDHIVVSRFGVFVVETKNFTGWIFADASSGIWTQVIYHEKNTFQNPMRQNFRHISAISENLGIPIGYIRGVVAFTGDCTFKTPMPEGVIYSRQAAEYIKSFATPILKEHERNDIVEALREWDASVTPEQRASHVGNLRKRHGG